MKSTKSSKNKVAPKPKAKHKAQETYKDQLLEVDNQQDKFDKIFEQKLAAQYREFRNLKEHHIQTKKFFRALIIIVTIILISLLIISFQ